jgi:hypothetical protein
LPLRSARISLNPVALCPGRGRLATSPMAIGSPTLTNTMGIVDANAIYNATGVRVRDYPITLDKFLDRLPDVL